MAAKTKSELINITRKEFEKLSKLMQSVDTDTAMKKREEDTSIKDVIAHRAHWIDLFLGWYFDGLAEKPVHFPAEGYKWNELKRFNADLRAQQSDLTWQDAQDLINTNYDKILQFMEDQSEDALYGGPMKGAKNPWTPGRWAEAAGPSHFRSASKYIRAALRSDA